MTPPAPITILLVDDARGFASGLARLLRRDGYTVDTAENGRLALTALQERPYDVLLCDLLMPELGGETFSDVLRHQYPALFQRVIFLTGDTMNPTSLAFLEQCGQPWLAKPCRADQVREVIQQLLDARAINAQPATNDGAAL
jgi:CheY-like chemotaxis protein